MEGTRRATGDVELVLSYAEAFVLSALLQRWERDGTQDRLPFEDHAEELVIWDLTATFEPLIDEAFSDDYDQALARHRSSLQERGPE
jgi:hypothetical protein